MAAIPSTAQLLPDNNLGTEGSITNPGVNAVGQPVDLIEGGARRGANLFHSFQEFNIGNLQRVYFANPTGVENILSRVTGNNPSNILGTLGVLGNATLFLLNPNGIVFGPNATLDVLGSFVASTASSIKFADGTEFSAVNPAATSLLTISVPIGLQYGSNPGTLQVQGATLQIPTGQVLALLGGNVSVNGGRLLAPGGRIELAGIAAGGTVDLTLNNSPPLLSFSTLTPRADVAIAGGAEVNVRAGGGGSIVIYSKNVDITASGLLAGIEAGLGSVGSQAGDIQIDALQAINLSSSTVVNVVATGSRGNSGNVMIRTGVLRVAGTNAALGSGIEGEGQAGNVTIDARDTVSLDGVGSNNLPNAVASIVAPTGKGDAGNVIVNTGSLNVTGGAGLFSSTLGAGNAGNVIINARGAVTFDGVSSNRLSSGAYSQSPPTGIGKGNGGSVIVTARSLVVTGGAQLGTATGREGNAGNVIVNVHDTARFDGVASNGIPSGAFSDVAATGRGNGGDIMITAGALSVTGGAQLSAPTLGAGNAGNVIINARDSVSFDQGAVSSTVAPTGKGNGGDVIITTGSLSVTGGAALIASTFGEGDAGDVMINARDTIRFGDAGGNSSPSMAESNVEEGGKGTGGNFYVDTRTLILEDGSNLTTAVRGNDPNNRAGKIFINARDAVFFDGVHKGGFKSSGVFSDSNGGSSGDINIQAASLSMTNGAKIASSNYGIGNAGNVNLVTQNTIRMDRSAVFSVTGGEGNGGDINIQSQHLLLKSDAALIGDVESTGKGRGGNINLDIGGTISLLGGTTASTGESTRITLGVQPGGMGEGGDLRIKTGALLLQDGGLIKVSTQGQGNAGNAFINAGTVNISGSVPSSGLPSGIFTSSDTTGNAGDITIDTQSFRIANGAALSARSRGDGKGGNITVNADRSFEAINGGQLITTTFGRGQAGDITVNAAEQLTIAGSDPNYGTRLAKFPNPISDFVANAIRETGPTSGFYANTELNSTAQGGDIRITTGKAMIRDGAQITVSSAGSGSAGNIELSASSILLNNQAQITANTTGSQGNITLQTDLLTMRRNSSITTNATGTATGGNINIDTDFILSAPNENNDIIANAVEGSGGQITISAQNIFWFNLRTRQDLQRLLNTTNPAELDPRRLPSNDITAFSQANPTIDTGTVSLQTPDLDPTRGLTALPTDLTDPSQLIAATCPADVGSSFAITGRGGLPEDPRQPLMGQVIWQDDRQGAQEHQDLTETQPLTTTKPAIVEAQAWIVDRTGTIVLVAQQPQADQRTAFRYPPCALSNLSP